MSPQAIAQQIAATSGSSSVVERQLPKVDIALILNNLTLF
jgi:hypothetical protein